MKRSSGLAVCTLLFLLGCGADGADANPTTPTPLAQEEAPQSFLVGTVTGKVGAAALSGTLSIERFFDEKGTVFAIGRFSAVTGIAEEVSKALTAQSIKLPVWVAPEGGFPTDGSAPSCEVLTLLLQPLRIDLAGTSITLDKVDLDITTTPGAGFVIGSIFCAEEGLLERGGRLSELRGDVDTRISILDGLTGLSFDGMPLVVPTVVAESLSAATPAAPTTPATTTPTKTP